MDNIGKIVVYDLPSENLSLFRGLDVRETIRNTRIRCVYRLHSLGLQCTESVILVPPTHVHRIDEIIDYVSHEYNELSRTLAMPSFVPLIRVLDITQEQREAFKDVAKRRLVERIDEGIERISGLIDEIDEITEPSRRKRVYYQLNSLRVEWLSIREVAGELGIDRGLEFSYLIDLIDQARQRLRGE